MRDEFGIELFQKKGEEAVQVWYKDTKIFEGEEKAVKEYINRLDKKSTPNRKLFLEGELKKLAAKKFHFQGYANRFDEHIERGHIKIKIKHSQTGEIVEQYEYATGKGGKEASQFQPPWQVKKEVSGVHSHRNIDGKSLRIKEVIEVRKLSSGENVEVIKLEFYVRELSKWVTKTNNSTMWPKGWTMDKIKMTTMEASQQILFKEGNKYRGISKDGVEVEFFTNLDGKINNSYIYK